MRAAIAVGGALLLAGALVALRIGAPIAAVLAPAVGGILVLLGTLWERRRNDLGAAPRGPGWRASGERFVDPESGQLVAVWHNDTSGERRYVRLGVKPD